MARSPDGAQRNPGQTVNRSRVALCSTRATGSSRPWRSPQWVPACAGMTKERGAGPGHKHKRHSRAGGNPLGPVRRPRRLRLTRRRWLGSSRVVSTRIGRFIRTRPPPQWIPACAGMTKERGAGPGHKHKRHSRAGGNDGGAWGGAAPPAKASFPHGQGRDGGAWRGPAPPMSPAPQNRDEEAVGRVARRGQQEPIPIGGRGRRIGAEGFTPDPLPRYEGEI